MKKESKTFSEHLFLDKAWNPRLQTYSGLSEILERQQTGASLFNYFSTTRKGVSHTQNKLWEVN
jgi:hypothetical protein